MAKATPQHDVIGKPVAGTEKKTMATTFAEPKDAKKGGK